MPERFDVFLCHNSHDKPAVVALGEALKAKHCRPWLDVWDLPLGVPWQEELEKVLETVPAVAVLIGRDGMGPWQAREMRAGLEEFVRRSARVIPVLLPGASKKPKLPLFLRSFNWLDLRGGMTEEDLVRLILGITGLKPESEQPAPGLHPPTLHNLPFVSLGPLFKGREDLLAKLSKDLETTSAAALVQPQAISGLGGIGKTRLAVELAWRSGARFPTVLFVKADSPQNLRSGLARLAELLHLGIAGEAEDRMVTEVLHWLRGNSGWLLILDNVDTEDAQKAVRELLTLSSGRVLVTSRLTVWPQGIKRLPVEILRREASIRLLLEATDGNRISTVEDEPLAGRVADLLGDLPLALEQAAAYIGARGISFSSYLSDWERDKPKVLAWYDEAGTDYPFSVAMTWNQTVNELSVPARALLRLLAHLSTEPVAVAMLEAGSAILGEGTEFIAQEENAAKPEAIDVLGSLGELARFSLVLRQEASVSIHRLVQEVVRSRISAEDRAAWVEKSVHIVRDFPPGEANDVRTWPVWDQLRPHATRAIELAEAEGIEEATIALRCQLGLLLATKGLYELAEPLLFHALKFTEKYSDPEHPAVAVCIRYYNHLLYNTRRFKEAEPLLFRALAIDEKHFGRFSPRTALDLSNLAVLFYAKQQTAEAELFIYQALEIDEHCLGHNHPEVAKDLSILGLLLTDTSRQAEAEASIRRALDIDEMHFGVDHPKVATRLFNLAQLLQATNRLAEAEPLMRRALDIFTRSLGEDHPNTQLVARNLAHLLQTLAPSPTE